MTQEDVRPIEPELWSMVVVEPGRWVAVHTIGVEPSADVPDGRMVVELFHDNDGPIELAVYRDGAVRFEGAMKDYPANGWRTRWMPFADSLYQATTQIDHPTNALDNHPRAGVRTDPAPG